MKKLTTIILLLLTITLNANVLQDVAKTASNVIDSTKLATINVVNTADTLSNFKMIYQDVKEGLTGLAQGLKVGVEHVYIILVKQQIINACVYLFLGIMSIIFAFLCYYQWGKIEVIKRQYNTEVKEIRPLVFTMAFGIISIITFVTFIVNIHYIVAGMGNPEYGAIKEIINFVQNTSNTCSTCK